MISVLTTEGFGFERRLSIVSRREFKDGWITVFIAENGCKKSLLLRCLAEHGIVRSPREAGLDGSVVPASSPPSRTIAISGTPLDRFPRVGTTDLKSRRRRSISARSFVYLGPRASNGMAGTAQSERSFVGSLIANRENLQGRISVLGEVFDFVGLVSAMDIHLHATRKLSSIEVVSEVSKYFDELAEAGLAQQPEVLSLRRSLAQTGMDGLLERVSSRLHYSNSHNIPQVKFRGGRVLPGDELSVSLLEMLMRIGAVEITRTYFWKSSNGVKVTGDHLSSGQWSWIGSLGGLALEIRDKSLILVDEPENSLHPKWQRNFVPELRKIVCGYLGCQVIVATHSPLVASGVSPEWGGVKTLVRGDRANSVVKSKPVESIYGWNSSDVYDGAFGLESSRAPDFIVEVNEVLGVISSGEAVSSRRAAQLRGKLRRLLRGLPNFDPMRNVISAAIEKISDLGGE